MRWSRGWVWHGAVALVVVCLVAGAGLWIRCARQRSASTAATASASPTSAVDEVLCDAVPTAVVDNALMRVTNDWEYWHEPASSAGAYPSDADYRCAMFGERPPDETVLVLKIMYRAGQWYPWNVPSTNKTYASADGAIPFSLPDRQGEGYVWQWPRTEGVTVLWLAPQGQVYELQLYTLKNGATPHPDVVDTTEAEGMKTILDSVIDTIPPVADGPAHHATPKADTT